MTESCVAEAHGCKLASPPSRGATRALAGSALREGHLARSTTRRERATRETTTGPREKTIGPGSLQRWWWWSPHARHLSCVGSEIYFLPGRRNGLVKLDRRFDRTLFFLRHHLSTRIETAAGSSLVDVNVRRVCLKFDLGLQQILFLSS